MAESNAVCIVTLSLHSYNETCTKEQTKVYVITKEAHRIVSAITTKELLCMHEDWICNYKHVLIQNKHLNLCLDCTK